MPKYELDIQGQKYEVEAENESALPEIAETIASQENVKPSRTRAIDEKIAGRQSAFEDVGGKLRRAAMPPGEAEGKALRGAVGLTGIDIGEESATSLGQSIGRTPAIQAAKTALPIVDAYGQLSESPVAGAGLALMRGEGFGGAKEGFTKGVTGEERVEFGDWYREMGMNEYAAKPLGLATALALDPFTVKQAFTKNAYNNVSKFFKNIARKSAKKKVRDVGGKTVIKRDLQQITADLKTVVRDRYNRAINKLGETTDTTLTKAQEKLRSKEAELSAMLKMDKMSVNSKILKTKDPRRIQATINNFFKRNSEIYKQRIDKISETMADSGKGLSMDDMGGVIDDVLVKAEESGLAESKVFKQLSKLKEKYLGKISKKGELIPPKRAINFKEMHGDYKIIRDSGAVDDVVAPMFSNKWKKVVSEKVDEFRVLQNEYSPVMELKSYMRKVFNLVDNKFETKSVDSFIKNSADGKLTSGQLELLEQLKKANPGFSDGVDLLSANSKSIVAQRQGIKAATLKELEGVKLQKQLVESSLEKKSGALAKSTLDIEMSKKASLDKIEKRVRVGKILSKQNAKFKQNQNWVRGIGSSILIYELATRPIRKLLFEQERN